MTAPRLPKSTAGATRMLQRYAELEGAVQAIETVRASRIAIVNAACDTKLEPLVKERDAIAATIGDWFAAAGHTLLAKGRKSMELGGCMIGTRARRASLAIAGEEKDVVAALSGLRWAKPFLRIKTSLNRPVLLSSLDGRHKVALAELGISQAGGDEQFFIDRAEQPGTIGASS